ncbi:hypothetical protein DFH29DRAFT_1001514 [Suillus ampliporus]|nr:hypothetical protein DFH29DRAFT_1001514 [Suillus ampliporus]
MSSPLLSNTLGSLHVGSMEKPDICANVENAGCRQELMSYLMALDGIKLKEDGEDQLFTQRSIDMVYFSYTTAHNCVLQYTQLLMLLKRDENLWAQRVEKAKGVMPKYKPAWWSLWWQE